MLSSYYYFFNDIVSSKDPTLRRRAIARTCVALSIDKYTRMVMVEALTGEGFARNTAFGSLLGESVSLYLQMACPKQGEKTWCTEHETRHHRRFYRHCGRRGELIHVSVSIILVTELKQDGIKQTQRCTRDAMANVALSKSI